MYVLNPIENLRGYITNRPPLVIFMISVSAVAIAFLTIGYFFKIKEIKSPELTEVSCHYGAWPHQVISPEHWQRPALLQNLSAAHLQSVERAEHECFISVCSIIRTPRVFHLL